MKTIYLILIAGALLSGCGSKDVEYYKNHPEEMKKKWEECKNMSDAEKMADRECSAVSQAESDRFFKSTIPRPGAGKGRGTKQF